MLGDDSSRTLADEVVLLIRRGEIPRAFHKAKALNRRAPSARARNLLQRVQGLLEAVDPDWLPLIPGDGEPPPDAPTTRIVHLFKVCYPFESTGGSIRNLNTVVSQKKHGLEPYVITPIHYPRNSGIGEFPLEQKVQGVPHYHFDFGWNIGKQVPSLSSLIERDTLAAASVIRRQGGSVIHAASGYHGYDLALKGLALGKHFDLPVIYEARSFHEHTWTGDRFYGECSTYTEMRKAQEHRCMRQADWVVTISNTMVEALSARGVDRGKITVIPNAINPDKFRTIDVDRTLRSQLFNSGQNVVGYISNISRREGHDVLLRAIAELRRRGTNVACLIVGEGPERESLQTLSRNLGIAEHVVFTGKVDHGDIDRYYSVIDVFVVPRRRDYASDLVTPLKPYEAMAMRKPLLVSDRPALREIVGQNEERGLVFRSEAHVDLAEKVQLFVESPHLQRRMAEKGRRWVLSERTWDANAKRYKELYAELLERRTSSRTTVAGRVRDGTSSPASPSAANARSKAAGRVALLQAEQLFDELADRAQQVFAEGVDKSLQDTFYQRFREFNDKLMVATNPKHLEWAHPRELEVKRGAQSKAFMMDLLPHIQAFLATEPRNSTLTVLDVGCAGGHGTNLLSSLYQSAHSLGYRLQVTGLDIVDDYQPHLRLFCPYITHRVADIYELDERKDTYDLVISSHTVEHVPEPLKFIRRMQTLARKRVFITAPFNEPEEGRTEGHINSFDDRFLASLEAVSLTKLHSPAWGAFIDPPYEVFIAELPPLAASASQPKAREEGEATQSRMAHRAAR